MNTLARAEAEYGFRAIEVGAAMLAVHVRVAEREGYRKSSDLDLSGWPFPAAVLTRMVRRHGAGSARFTHEELRIVAFMRPPYESTWRCAQLVEEIDLQQEAKAGPGFRAWVLEEMQMRFLQGLVVKPRSVP